MVDFSALVARYQRRLLYIPQAASVRMSDLVVLGTPYRTGSAQASWNPTIGAPQGGSVNVEGGARYPQRSTVRAVARALRLGQSYSLASRQSYIRSLEYGHSAQAPAGMLRVATAQWQPVVEEAVREAIARA